MSLTWSPFTRKELAMTIGKKCKKCKVRPSFNVEVCPRFQQGLHGHAHDVRYHHGLQDYQTLLSLSIFNLVAAMWDKNLCDKIKMM